MPRGVKKADLPTKCCEWCQRSGTIEPIRTIYCSCARMKRWPAFVGAHSLPHQEVCGSNWVHLQWPHRLM